MILETFHAERLPNGYWRRETRFQEFDTLEQLEGQLMLYKLESNLGFRVYDCTLKQYNQADRDTHLIRYHYDRQAIINLKEKKNGR